jgi:hypothetical protein
MRCVNTLIRVTFAMENMSYSKVVKCSFDCNDKQCPIVLSLYSYLVLSLFLYSNLYVRAWSFCLFSVDLLLFFPCLFHVHLCTFRPNGNPRHAAGMILVLSMSLGLSLPCPWTSFALSLPYPWASYCLSLLFPWPVPALFLAFLWPVLPLSLACSLPVLSFACP